MQRLLRVDAYPNAAGLGSDAWLSSITGLFGWLDATIGLWAMRTGTRRALAGLEPQQLADIGKTSAETRHESGKAFWGA